jgi:hypothetical protein
MCVALDHVRAKKTAKVVYTGTIAEDDTTTSEDELVLVEKVIGGLADDGIAVFAAAGNKPATTVPCPGSVAGAITVGWYDGAVTKSPHDDAGKPTFLAPFSKFRSYGDRCRDGSSCYVTARMAGLVATWLQDHPTMSRADIMRILEAACVAKGHMSKAQQGWGVFDPAKVSLSMSVSGALLPARRAIGTRKRRAREPST